MCPQQIPSGVADSLGGNLVFPAALECHPVMPTSDPWTVYVTHRNYSHSLSIFVMRGHSNSPQDQATGCNCIKWI